MGASIFDSLVTIKRSGEDGARFEFSERPWASVGSHDDCDILIHAQGVALLHALVTTAENDEPRIYGLDKDLPVSIPSRGVELRESKYARIHHGDVFYCGERGFRFERKDTERKKRRSSVKKRKSTKRTARKSMVITDMDEKFVDGPANSTRVLIQAERLSMGAHEIASAIAQDNDLPTPAAFDADGNEKKDFNYQTPEKASEVDTSHLESLDVQLSPLPITAESFYTNTPTSDSVRKSMVAASTPTKDATPLRTRTPGRVSVAVTTPSRTRTPLRVIAEPQSQSEDDSSASSAEAEQVTVAVSSMRATPKKSNSFLTSVQPASKKQRMPEKDDEVVNSRSGIRPPTRFTDIRRGNTPARPALTSNMTGSSSFTPRRNPTTPAKKGSFTPRRNQATPKPKFTPRTTTPSAKKQFTPRRILTENSTDEDAEKEDKVPVFTPKRVATPAKSGTPGKRALSEKKLFTPSRRAVLAIPDVDEYATRLVGFKSPAKKSPLSDAGSAKGSASKPISNKLVAKTPGLAPLTFTPSPSVPTSSPRLRSQRPAYKAEVDVVMEEPKRRKSARTNLEKGVFTKSPLANASPKNVAPASPWVHIQHGASNSDPRELFAEDERGVAVTDDKTSVLKATTSNDSEITPAQEITSEQTALKPRKSRASTIKQTPKKTAMERTPRKAAGERTPAKRTTTPSKQKTPGRKTPGRKTPSRKTPSRKAQMKTPTRPTPKAMKTIVKTPVRSVTPGRTPSKSRVTFTGMELEKGPHYSPADKTPKRITVAVPGTAPTSRLATLGTFFFPSGASPKDDKLDTSKDEIMDDVSDNDVAKSPVDTQPESEAAPRRKSLTERISALFFSPPSAPEPVPTDTKNAAAKTSIPISLEPALVEEEATLQSAADPTDEKDPPSNPTSVEASPAYSEEDSSAPAPRRRSLLGGVRYLASGVLHSLVHSPARSLLGIEVEEDEDTEDTMQNSTVITDDEKVPEDSNDSNMSSVTPKSAPSSAGDAPPSVEGEEGATTSSSDTKSNLIDRFNNVATTAANNSSPQPMEQDDNTPPEYTPRSPASMKSKSPRLEEDSSDSEGVTPIKPVTHATDMDLDAFEKPMDTSDAITNDEDDTGSDASTIEEPADPVEKEIVEEDDKMVDELDAEKSPNKEDKPKETNDKPLEEKDDEPEDAVQEEEKPEEQEPTDYTKWTVKDLKKYLSGVDISVKGMKKADLVIAAQKADGTHAEEEEGAGDDEESPVEEAAEDSEESPVEEAAEDSEESPMEEIASVEDSEESPVKKLHSKKSKVEKTEEVEMDGDTSESDHAASKDKEDSTMEDSDAEGDEDLRPVLMKLTVAKLRGFLKKIGGEEKGKKAELVDRLLQESTSTINDLVDGKPVKKKPEAAKEPESDEPDSVEESGEEPVEEDSDSPAEDMEDVDEREDRGNELKGLTVKKLQGLLAKLKLDKVGKKGELIERILNHEFDGDEMEEEEVEEESEEEEVKVSASRKKAPAKKGAAKKAAPVKKVVSKKGPAKKAPAKKSKGPIDDVDLSKMTVAKLRTYLKKHKVDQTGLKAVLLDRATQVQAGTYEGDAD